MEPRTIEGLREKLFTANVLSEVADYFFDLMEDDRFLNLGKSYSVVPPVIEAVLTQLSSRYSPANIGRAELKLIRIEEHGFIHGTCLLNNLMGIVMLFEDDNCGMFSVTLPDGRTEMARFGATPVSRRVDPTPSSN